MNQRERVDFVAAFVILKDRANLCANLDRLHRIADEVADHTHVLVVRQFDQDDEVRAAVLQRRMDGVPDAFPGVDASVALNLAPAEIEAVTDVAHPLRTELGPIARVAVLDEQLVPLETFPVLGVEPVDRWGRRGACPHRGSTCLDSPLEHRL